MRDDKHEITNPTMFAADERTIFYPTAPGRVYAMDILTLADCNGSDEDFADSTTRTDIRGMLNFGADGLPNHAPLLIRPWPGNEAPAVWPAWKDHGDHMTSEQVDEVDSDFADALEQWADWCDRDSVRLDSLDEVRGRIERAA